MRFVQLKAGGERRLAMVEEPKLRLLRDFNSLYTLAHAATITGDKLTALADHYLSDDVLDYEQIYQGTADWKLLPPIDHPAEPARCLVSGTGLTHLGSARDRQSMHLAKEQDLTDSMKMFQWGVEGGHPAKGETGSPRSGSTRATVPRSERTTIRFLYPRTPQMGAKKPRSPPHTLSA